MAAAVCRCGRLCDAFADVYTHSRDGSRAQSTFFGFRFFHMITAMKAPVKEKALFFSSFSVDKI